MTAGPPLAFVAGGLAALAALEAAGAIAPSASRRGRRIASGAAALTTAVAEVLGRPAREGRNPERSERRRLLTATAALALFGVTVAVGLLPGLLAAALAPAGLARVLRLRRERYRQEVAAHAGQLASVLADALGAGHSVRGAILETAPALEGPAGRELRRAAGELAVGARTEDVLERLPARAGSHEVDTIVAGVLLQRRAGGDLARLLRESARAFEDQARLRGEATSATAQARFTGIVVVVMPLGGALLAELASPGFLGGLADDFLTAWLVGLAAIMQAVAVILIRRLGRVRE